MGIDELGDSSRPQRLDTPLSQRPLSWWLFYMPGTVILWFGYMFPNNVTHGIAGARQRNVPLLQLGYTLVLYIVIAFICVALYSMSGNGRREKLISAFTDTEVTAPPQPAPMVEAEPEKPQLVAREEARPNPVEATAAEVEDPLKKEIQSRLTPQYTSCMSGTVVTSEMLECISAETKIQDDALNATYKRVIGKLEPEGQATVRQAQRAWIKERDDQCDKEAAEFEGGTLATVTHADCYLRKEIERTIQLEWIEPR